MDKGYLNVPGSGEQALASPNVQGFSMSRATRGTCVGRGGMLANHEHARVPYSSVREPWFVNNHMCPCRLNMHHFRTGA